ncbi:MAG: ROK family protein [Planctomycetia bacterium]|nr:ROK family protein [Planctomycetia bacterium]
MSQNPNIDADEQRDPQDVARDVARDVAQTPPSEPLYVGMDVGGTKIRTCLVSESGQIHDYIKEKTPRDCPPETTIEAIKTSIETLLENNSLQLSDLTGIGIAIPGVVIPRTGDIVVTPNMNLTGISLGTQLREYFGIPVSLGNDGNLGALGETWLGAAQNAKSVVGIFVGTGVGSGIVLNERLWSGAAYAAGEIGHIVAQAPVQSWRERLNIAPQDSSSPTLPTCGCGNVGCLESLASRTAIERQIREALDAGFESCIVDFCDGDISLIRAGSLARALKAKDPLVSTIVQHAAEILAYTCLTVRHLIDPEVILLGGGVMEACSRYILPTIERIVLADKLPAAPSRRRIALSQLGDDAVVLGAVALAITEIRFPPQSEESIFTSAPRVVAPNVELRAGHFVVGDETFESNFCIDAAGRAFQRLPVYGKNPGKIRCKEIKTVCGGFLNDYSTAARSQRVDSLFIGTSYGTEVFLTQKAIEFVHSNGISVHILPQEEAVERYNECSTSKAALFADFR